MHGSCHLNRALNFEIGVEYQMIFVVVVFNDAVKCILGYLQDESFHYKTCTVIHPSFQSSRK